MQIASFNNQMYTYIPTYIISYLSSTLVSSTPAIWAVEPVKVAALEVQSVKQVGPWVSVELQMKKNTFTQRYVNVVKLNGKQQIFNKKLLFLTTLDVYLVLYSINKVGQKIKIFCARNKIF